MRAVRCQNRRCGLPFLVPCYNEATTIAQVVRGFTTNLPSATVYVYDNNSSDQSAERAAAAGAVVRNERHQGKGHVARRMFADIDADVYIMVDGDTTYDPTVAPDAVAEMLRNKLFRSCRHFSRPAWSRACRPLC